MSRAVTTNTLRFRDVYHALKSACNSANAGLSSLFSASDLYFKQVQEASRYIYQSWDMAFSSVWGVPLGNELPPLMGLPPLMASDGFEHENGQRCIERPALSYPQVLALPEGNFQNEQPHPEVNADDVEMLVAVLREKTRTSPKVEALPSGAVKITLDEYFMGTNKKEPEFVTVRR
jgi:hypothetical protein